MRARSVVIVLLMIAVPAASAAAPADEETVAPTSEAPVETTDPLAFLPWSTWIPMSEKAEDHDDQIAIVASSETPGDGTSYGLTALGDADKDGTIDYLLATTVSKTTIDPKEQEIVVEEQTSIELLSGAGFKSLWKKDVPKDHYFYTMKDGSGDGVDEVVIVKRTAAPVDRLSQDAGPVWVYKYNYTYTSVYNVLNPLTGDAAFSRSCTSTISFTVIYADAIVAGGGFDEFLWRSCFLTPMRGEPGFQLLTSVSPDRSVDVGGGAGPGYVSGGVFFGGDEVFIERLDGAGKPLWSKRFQQVDRDHLVRSYSYDLTGDGVNDYVISAAPSQGVGTYSTAGSKTLRDPRPAQLFALDGKTSQPLWTIDYGQPYGYISFFVGATLQAPGVDIIQLHYGVTATPPFAYFTTVTHIDGAKGTPFFTKTFDGALVEPAPFADVDKDGLSELLIRRRPITVSATGATSSSNVYEVTVAKGDYTPVWGPLSIDPRQRYLSYGGINAPDFDGDGVGEVSVTERGDGNGGSSRVVFLSGASGKELWSYSYSERLLGVRAVGDLDGQPGSEVAYTIFDVPEHAAPKPNVGPGGSAPQPSSTSEPEQRNYANYDGWLEVRRGLDNELLWRKQIYDHTKYVNVSADSLYIQAIVAPDHNGDGVSEIVYNLDSFYRLPDLDEVEELPKSFNTTLAFALLLSGADGETLRSYPAGAASAPALVGKAAPKAKLAGAPAGGGSVPSLALLLVVGALVGVVALRRRHA
ncbi:MAG: hypothetical protein HYT80_07480 [Euryarchaeota archaeon]|nr:hypothetical protein [Euryarchaeota archaeon]